MRKNIGVTLADALSLDITDSIHRAWCQRAIAQYAEPIAHELAQIGALSEEVRVAHALTFSILSPQADFDFNVAATQPCVNALREGIEYHDLAALILSHGLGLHFEKAERLLACREVILGGTLPTWANLQELRGIGPKVASMAHALNNEWAPCVTLDRHMARLYAELAQTPMIRRGLRDGAYLSFMAFLLERWEVFFPEISPFTLQWALWCLVFDDFKSHLGIFGLK